MPGSKLGQQLKRLRKEVEQAMEWYRKPAHERKFTTEVGIDKSLWNRFENGERSISIETLVQVLEKISKLTIERHVGAIEAITTLLDSARQQLSYFQSPSITPDPRNAEYRSTILKISQRLRLRPAGDFSSEVTELCIAEAQRLYWRQDYHGALKAVELARQISPANLESLLWEAKLHLYSPSGDESFDWHTAFDNLQTEIELPLNLRAEWLALLGTAWCNHPNSTSNLSKAEEYFRTAIESASNSESSELDLATWHGDLGVVKFQLSEHAAPAEKSRLIDESVELFTIARDKWGALNKIHERAILTMRLANLRWMRSKEVANKSDQMKEFNRAFALYREAREVFNSKRTKSKIDCARVDYSWADAEYHIAMSHRESPKQSFQWLEKAVIRCKRAITNLNIDNGREFGDAHWNLAETYLEMAGLLLEHSADIATKDSTLDDSECYDLAITSYLESIKVWHFHFNRHWWQTIQQRLSIAYYKRWQLTHEPDDLKLAIASAKAGQIQQNIESLKQKYIAAGLHAELPFELIAVSTVGVFPPEKSALIKSLEKKVHNTIVRMRESNISFDLEAVKRDLRLFLLEAKASLPNRRWFQTAAIGLVDAAHLVGEDAEVSEMIAAISNCLPATATAND